jgi:predicted ribosomally synthesized peptide with nif11-like leader
MHMSLESAKAFFAKVKTDDELAKKLAEAGSEEKLREIIATVGDFDFSQQEWTDAVLAESGVEISEEDLEKVAGGGGYLTTTVSTYPGIFASSTLN